MDIEVWKDDKRIFEKMSVAVREKEGDDLGPKLKKLKMTLPDAVAEAVMKYVPIGGDCTVLFYDVDFEDWLNLEGPESVADCDQNKIIKVKIIYSQPKAKFNAAQVMHIDSMKIIKLKKDMELRLPQKETLLQMRRVLRPTETSRELPNPSRFMILLPTGVGKTWVMLLTPFVVDAKKVLVITKDTLLSNQIMNEFRVEYNKLWPRIQIQEYKPKTISYDCDIICTNIQALAGRVSKGAGNANIEAEEGEVDDVDAGDMVKGPTKDFLENYKPDLIICDEGHHSQAESWKAVESYAAKCNPELKLVLVTATPHRGDGKFYGIPRMSSPEEQFYYRFTRQEAVTNGYIKSTTYHPVDVGDKEQNYSTYRDESYIHSMIDPAVEILRGQRASCNDRPFRMLVTVRTNKDAEDTVKLFNKRSGAMKWNLKAAQYSGKRTNGSDYNNFKSPLIYDAEPDKKIIDVMVQVQMMSEGYDNPWISISVFLSPAMSVGKLSQIHGRSIRAPKYSGYALHPQAMYAHMFYPSWERVETVVQEYKDGLDESEESLFSIKTFVADAINLKMIHKKLIGMTCEDAYEMLQEGYDNYHNIYAALRQEWKEIPAEALAVYLYDSLIANAKDLGKEYIKIIDFGCGREMLLEAKLEDLCSQLEGTTVEVLAIDVFHPIEDSTRSTKNLTVKTLTGEYTTFLKSFDTFGESSYDSAVFCLSFMMSDSFELGLLEASKAVKADGKIFIVLSADKLTGTIHNNREDEILDMVAYWCEKLQEVTGFQLSKSWVSKCLRMVYLELNNIKDDHLSEKLKGIEIKHLRKKLEIIV